MVKLRLKENKAREEKEHEVHPTERAPQRQVSKAMERISEQEKTLKEKERKLLEKIHALLKKHELMLENDKEYQVRIRKSLASQKGRGFVGDLTGKGYVEMDKKGERYMYTDRLPVTSEARFETINTLPKISSKYKSSNQGFSLEKMSERDPNFMI